MTFFDILHLTNCVSAFQGFSPRGSIISSRTSSCTNLKKMYNKDLLRSVPFPAVSSVSTANVTVKRRSTRSLLFNSGCSRSGSSGLKYYVDTNKIIYKSTENLMTAANLRAICRLQDSIMQSSSYYSIYIERDYSLNRSSCPSFSIPNYIASYNSLSSCSELTDNHVNQFIKLLQNCSNFYRNGQLQKCVDDTSQCASLPPSCNSSPKKGMIYNVFQYLADSSFPNNPASLKNALATENLNNAYNLQNTLYKSVYEKKLKDLEQAKFGNVQVAAFKFFDLKFTIFNTQMLTEASLIVIALVFVLFAIWMYSGSIFIGLMTFACVILALVLSYFIYGIIFRLPFFPFLNVLTLIFLVGIGADDAFVYMGVYKEAKTIFPYSREIGYENNFINWTAYTLRRALLAMFVTSFTTAAAFYSSLSSAIIAVRCFSIYAGTSILVNYLLMATWFPAVVVLYDKYLDMCTRRCCYACCSSRRDYTVVESIFAEILPKGVIKARFVLVIVLLGIGIGGIVVVFVKPKLQLSSTSEFQMFSSSNSLEQYSLNYKRSFSFESSGTTWYMPIYFVFGVKAEDTRNKFNPSDKGTVILNPSFDMVSPDAQTWLHNFCSDLRNASFVNSLDFSSSLSTCNKILELWKVLSRNCSTTPFPSPCCNRAIPMSSHDFNYCLRSFIKYNNLRRFESVLFDRSNKTRALVVYASSNQKYTEAYNQNDKFFNAVESWLKERQTNAPEGFKNGWWRSYQDFYDLQKSLASGTELSLAISVAIAFGVLLLTTWNVIISLYSILSIACVIAVSVGILVLSGWRLNILESIVISTAAGLSVDFTIHYGVAYRIAPNKDNQKERVRYALVHIGSAVTMGALTTFIAGKRNSFSSLPTLRLKLSI